MTNSNVNESGVPPVTNSNFPTQPSDDKGLAIASMVCGIIAIFMPIIGIPLALIALVLAIVSLAKKRGGQGFAITGLILSTLSIIFTAIICSIVIAGIGVIADYCKENPDSCDIERIVEDNGCTVESINGRTVINCDSLYDDDYNDDDDEESSNHTIHIAPVSQEQS